MQIILARGDASKFYVMQMRLIFPCEKMMPTLHFIAQWILTGIALFCNIPDCLYQDSENFFFVWGLDLGPCACQGHSTT
jgi:hypothetical protein